MDRGGDQTCPTEQRYTNCQLVRLLLVTTISYNYTIQCIVPHSHALLSVFTVLHRASVCAVTHLCMYTCIHQGSSAKSATSNSGLCCYSSHARSFVGPPRASVSPNVTTYRPPPPPPPLTFHSCVNSSLK